MVGLGSSGTTSRLQRVRMNSRRVTRALCVATLQRRRASCDHNSQSGQRKALLLFVQFISLSGGLSADAQHCGA